MICDVCAGRGWLPSPRAGGGADPCWLCGGKREPSWGEVARMLDEDPDTLARVRQMRSRPKTAERVFDKVCKLLWPKGQTEMFI